MNIPNEPNIVAHNDYTSNSNPYSPFMNGDVVQMHYNLYMAKMDTGAEKTELCNTFSYTKGISVSSITWGFTSPGAFSGDNDSTRIIITLHDIAGKLINDVLKLRSNAYFLHFTGPTSMGSPWTSLGGKEAVFYTVQDECKIEFSPTQGFTYTITGSPIVQLAKSKITANQVAFTLTGQNNEAGDSFKSYISSLEKCWNSAISEDQLKPNAQIKLEVRDHFLATQPVKVSEKIKNGGKDKKIEPFKIAKGETVANTIRKLYHSRFEDPEHKIQSSKEGSIGEKAEVEVNFLKWQGDIMHYEIKFNDVIDKKATTSLIPICIGSDLVCKGQPFRAQLSNMDFSGIYSLLTVQAIKQDAEHTDTNDSTALAGTDGSQIKKGTDKDVARLTQENLLRPEYTSENITPGSWGEIDALLKSNKLPGFTIEVEMPYTFAFTPESHGGLLLDAIKDTSSTGIHMSQGANLMFWWYTEPTCSTLVMQPGISGDYRITKVMHSIGLNGNSTQVSLGHLTANT